jgi:integrase
MNALTDTTIRAAKPADKPYKLSDTGGLYLYITPTGGRLWRVKYRYGDKEKTLSIGKYPDVPLKGARARRDEAKKALASGEDPGAAKQARKAERRTHAANTFEAVATLWFEQWRKTVAPRTAGDQWNRLVKYAFPTIGTVPVGKLTARHVWNALQPMEADNLMPALHQTKGAIGMVMRFAIHSGRADRNPVPDLAGAFATHQGKHHATLLEPPKIARLLHDIEAYQGVGPSVKYALRLLPLVFVRPCELRAAKWHDIDLEKGEWKFFVGKTKVEHLVPLSRQAVAILRELHPMTSHDRSGLVFPGRSPGRTMAGGTLNEALRAMGYDTQADITGHGFRAMARTLLAEELGEDPYTIEHQLAHAVPDKLGTAYNRTKYLKQRAAMMQAWADYLDRVKAGADVIPIRGAA